MSFKKFQMPGNNVVMTYCVSQQTECPLPTEHLYTSLFYKRVRILCCNNILKYALQYVSYKYRSTSHLFIIYFVIGKQGTKTII